MCVRACVFVCVFLVFVVLSRAAGVTRGIGSSSSRVRLSSARIFPAHLLGNRTPLFPPFSFSFVLVRTRSGTQELPPEAGKTVRPPGTGVEQAGLPWGRSPGLRG